MEEDPREVVAGGGIAAGITGVHTQGGATEEDPETVVAGGSIALGGVESVTELAGAGIRVIVVAGAPRGPAAGTGIQAVTRAGSSRVGITGPGVARAAAGGDSRGGSHGVTSRAGALIGSARPLQRGGIVISRRPCRRSKSCTVCWPQPSSKNRAKPRPLFLACLSNLPKFLLLSPLMFLPLTYPIHVLHLSPVCLPLPPGHVRGDSAAHALRNYFTAKFLPPLRGSLPLPPVNTWAALVTLFDRLKFAVETIRQSCGDLQPDWHPEWTNPVLRYLVSSVDSLDNTEVSRSATSSILKIGTELNKEVAAKSLTGPEGFHELVHQITKTFTTFHGNSIPVMLAEHCVPTKTPLKDWISLLKDLVEGLSCFGTQCPSDFQIVNTAADRLAVQNPEISALVSAKLRSLTSVEAMWDSFKSAGLNEMCNRATNPVAIPTRYSGSTVGILPKQ